MSGLLKIHSNATCKRLVFRTTAYVTQKKFASKSSKDNAEIPKNLLADYISAPSQPDKGVIYDKKPFKITLDPEKTYAWCACGKSKSQPMCDGTHKSPYLKITMRPVLFKVTEKKEYWLCNCKQTSNRPFCDGTHKREDIKSTPGKN